MLGDLCLSDCMILLLGLEYVERSFIQTFNFTPGT